MLHFYRRPAAVAAFLLTASALLWLSLSSSRAQQRGDTYLSTLTTAPGGTPEDRLWQVLVLMGAGDTEPADWSGGIAIDSGEIHQIDGYRFESPDRILPQGGWKLKTKVEQVRYGSASMGQDRHADERRLVPKGVLVRGDGTPATRVIIRTTPGACEFTPLAMPFGTLVKCANGRVEVRRVPAATDLSGTELRQHDFPAIAASPDGALWAAWSSFHDRQEELNFRRYQDGRWTRLIPVPRAAADLWRPQVAVDDSGTPWLIWSQRKDGNWDLYAMPWEGGQWGKLERITDNPLPDIEPHVARGPDGTVYVVWQALVGSYAQIHLRYRKNGQWSETIPVTSGKFDNWEPSVAAGPGGRVWIAWDRYTTSYDIFCRSYSPSAGLSSETQVAATNRYETSPSIAVDSQGRPWVAWETGGVNWGKDLGYTLGSKSPGSSLGGARGIQVACLDGGEWKSPASVPSSDLLSVGSTGESRPLLFFDPDGNLWMAFQRRFSRAGFRGSVFWEYYLTRLDGDRWSDPLPLPDSWGRKSTRLGLTAAQGRLWAFWPTERRGYAFAPRPLAFRVIAGSLTLPGPGRAPALSSRRPNTTPAPPGHSNEAADVAAVRGHTITVAGETLRILRGDLHRHTELSQDDGGLSDSSLPEFYRYMIDAAAMDFGASTDHQAGGCDYWNFLTQKMADMYLFPERFVPLYAYERNVSNPHGHRNIVHTSRDYPIVPFFQSMNPGFLLPDSPDGELLTFNSNSFGRVIRNDTQLLYEELRKSGGLAIPHTSGSTDMGTDWGDNDPKLDPVVEIYQGDRVNYEEKNAPRGFREGEERKAPGGYFEPGLVWNAWKKGYRLGVIASSDHFSTHISYAMVYSPSRDRRAIFDAIRKRHTYGATDNIVLEFWMGDHFMGDDFTAAGPQKIRVKARGTGDVSAVHLIRDASYVYKVSPGRPDVDFEYLDAGAGAGEHWYYVRLEQANGELAWSSPIWVRY